MITTQVVETSVTVTNSPIEDYTHPDDLIPPTNDPVFFLTKQGEGPGLRGPPSQSELSNVWHWNSYIDRITTDHISRLKWLIFLTKHALHFATKLNSRDIQKCNCFWVPSYDLFASARKAVHGKGLRNYNVQPRLVCEVWGEVICHKKVQQPFPNRSLDPPPPPKLPQSKIPVDPPLQNHL